MPSPIVPSINPAAERARRSNAATLTIGLIAFLSGVLSAVLANSLEAGLFGIVFVIVVLGVSYTTVAWILGWPHLRWDVLMTLTWHVGR
jgi:hypothetical protein